MCPWASQCGEARLLAFVAGKVRGPDGARLREHLDDCERCRDYVARQNAIWELLDEWEPEFAGDDFNSEVAVRVANLAADSWFVQTGRFVMARISRPAFAVTAVTAVVAVSLYLRNPFAGSVDGAFGSRAMAAPAPRIISPVEAEQMDRAFDDLQLLHQLDAVSESSKDAARPM